MTFRRVLRTQSFSRWMLNNGLTNAALLQAMDEMASSLADALLCGELLEVMHEH